VQRSKGDTVVNEEHVSEVVEVAAEDEKEPGETGWGHDAVRALRFWLLLAIVLMVGMVGGTALGIYAVPAGNLPGDPNFEADLAAANVRLTELEETAAEHDAIVSALDETIALADINLEIHNTSSALLYTLRATEEGGCADFLGFTQEGEFMTLQLSQVYPCGG
jgi:hypothetical protein